MLSFGLCVGVGLVVFSAGFFSNVFDLSKIRLKFSLSLVVDADNEPSPDDLDFEDEISFGNSPKKNASVLRKHLKAGPLFKVYRSTALSMLLLATTLIGLGLNGLRLDADIQNRLPFMVDEMNPKNSIKDYLARRYLR